MTGVVHPGELAAHDDVLAVADDVPRALPLAGEPTGLDGWKPVEQTRRRVPGEVEVAERLTSDRAGGCLTEREPTHPRPRTRFRETTDVAAVVGVTNRIDGRRIGMDRVAVAVAVADPVDAPTVPRGGEDTLEVAARSEHVTGAVHIGAIAVQRGDAGIGTRRANDRVGCPRDERTRDRVDRSQAVPGCGRPVHRGELTADHEARAVGRDHHRGDEAADGARRPVEQCAVGRRKGCEVVARRGTDASEVAADVHGGVGGDDRVDEVPHVGGEGVGERARGDVERGHAVASYAVDGREVATHVEAGVVGRHGDRAYLGVEDRSEGGVEHARLDVVRQDVGARHRVDTRRRTGGPRRREPSTGEHPLPGDHLRPDDTIDLHRRQRIGGHGGRRWRRGRVSRRCVGADRQKADRQEADDCGSHGGDRRDRGWRSSCVARRACRARRGHHAPPPWPTSSPACHPQTVFELCTSSRTNTPTGALSRSPSVPTFTRSVIHDSSWKCTFEHHGRRVRTANDGDRDEVALVDRYVEHERSDAGCADGQCARQRHDPRAAHR